MLWAAEPWLVEAVRDLGVYSRVLARNTPGFGPRTSCIPTEGMFELPEESTHAGSQADPLGSPDGLHRC